MEKKTYIQARLDNNHTVIVFNYAVEHGFKGDIRDFTEVLNHFSMIDPDLVNSAFLTAILFYDLKFKLTYVTRLEDGQNIIIQIY